MRFILIATFFLFAGCLTRKSNSKTIANLNGTWIPVRQQIGGKDLPQSAFQNQKLVILDSSYSYEAESVDKGIVTTRNGNMDVYGKDGVNAGKHFTAIYKLENGQLVICYNLRGDAYPTHFETKSSPALFISAFKRE